ncbi:MAG TPA: sigma factor, partial [Acidimicrobiales bacterium]|nr:sigma factor [Acidimicrobiales bacterium]
MPKTRRLSDATLVRRSQQGDRRAFGALVARYDRRLRGLAHALLLDRRQMDAALGLAYLRAWRDVVRIKPRDEVGPWLYRAAYNACIDQLRRGEAPADVTDGLRSGLAGLAPADRVAVVLVEREGFTVASAARILGVGVDVIETRLDVARDHLKPWTPEPAAPAPAEPATVEAAADEPAPAEPPTDEAAPAVPAPAEPATVEVAADEPALAEPGTVEVAADEP